MLDVQFELHCEELIARLIAADPSMDAVISTMRNQQHKAWSKIALCFQKPLIEFGIARQADIRIDTYAP